MYLYLKVTQSSLCTYFVLKCIPLHRQYMLNLYFLHIHLITHLISLSLAACNMDKLLGLSWSFPLRSEIQSEFLWLVTTPGYVLYSHPLYKQIHPRDESAHDSREKQHSFRAHKKASLYLSLDVVLRLLEATTASDIAHPTTLISNILKYLFFSYFFPQSQYASFSLTLISLADKKCHYFHFSYAESRLR